MGKPSSIFIPNSYEDLPFTQIRISHHPASSSAVTSIVVLSLHRVEKHNAFSITMRDEIVQAYRMFDVDDRVKAIVFTAKGRIFCAGADLQRGFNVTETAGQYRDIGGQATLAIYNCQKPTVAAITGAAVGIGISLTLAMNIRIALRTAKIGFVFARRGLVMEAASSFFLPRLLGYTKALHLTTTGAVYKAEDSLVKDLFSELLDTPEEVFAFALGIAEDIAKNTSSVCTYLMKEMMFRDTGSPEAQHLLDSRILHGMYGKADNKEGMQSFLQKRQPSFVGTLGNNAPDAFPWWHAPDTNQRAKAESGDGKSKL